MVNAVKTPILVWNKSSGDNPLPGSFCGISTVVAGSVTNENLPGFDDIRKIWEEHAEDVDKMLIIEIFILSLCFICLHCIKDSQRFS